MQIDLIAVGIYKSGPLVELVKEYSKRMKWGFKLIEIPSPKHATSKDECAKIEKNLHKNTTIIALDERGKTLSSEDFADKISTWQMHDKTHLTFIIGGADGLTDALRKKAHFLLSFGKQTWPHQLVRVMIVEQVYRAQQILAGHPYHRS